MLLLDAKKNQEMFLDAMNVIRQVDFKNYHIKIKNKKGKAMPIQAIFTELSKKNNIDEVNTYLSEYSIVKILFAIEMNQQFNDEMRQNIRDAFNTFQLISKEENIRHEMKVQLDDICENVVTTHQMLTESLMIKNEVNQVLESICEKVSTSLENDENKTDIDCQNNQKESGYSDALQFFIPGPTTMLLTSAFFTFVGGAALGVMGPQIILALLAAVCFAIACYSLNMYLGEIENKTVKHHI